NDDILRYMPKSYSTPISYGFPHPSSRAERLHEVLRDSGGFTVADFERLQHDDLSLIARQIVPAMLAATTRAGAGSRPEVRALASWNYHMSRDAYAPLVFEVWSAAVARAVADAVYSPTVAPLFRWRVQWSVVDSVLRSGGRGDAIAVAALDSTSATIA